MDKPKNVPKIMKTCINLKCCCFLEKYFKSTMYEDFFISTKKKKLMLFMTKVLYKYGSEKMTN